MLISGKTLDVLFSYITSYAAVVEGKESVEITYDVCVCLQGGREVDDFVKYLAKEATNELQGFDRNGKKKGGKKKKKTEL